MSPEAHLDLDLGLESLDRIELLAELQRSQGVDLDNEAAGRVHTVAELIDALAAAGPAAGRTDMPVAGAKDAAATAAGDGNWAEVLTRTPADIDRHLRRRPVLELITFLLLRGLRTLWWLAAGFRARGVEHVPTERPFVLCANHASYVDPFVLCMALPRRALARVFFVGYSEYFEGFFGSKLGRLFRNIPIDPNRNLERAMQAAAEGLRRGMVLVIFPEGSRSLDGEVREFRRGAGILARHAGVALLPAGIWGAFRVWPRQGPKRRHPVAVEFGEALHPGAEGDEQELLASLRETVVSLVGRAAAR